MARNSKIIIAKNIKIDKEYKEVLNYTEQQMLALVNANKIDSSNSYSFIKDTGEINTHFSYDDCLKCNYMAFQNPDYDNKWFFAFIDDIKYVNDATTNIKFTIDAWSTWFSKLTINSSFVIREHINDDTIGNNLVPENLETGEFVINNRYIDNKLSQMGICVMLSDRSTTTQARVDGALNGGVYSGCIYDVTNINSISYVNNLLTDYDNAGKHDAIVGIFMCPTGVIDGFEPDATIGLELSSDEPFVYNYNSVNINNTIDGYTPKNNKLFTYPYNYLVASNNNGIDKVYRYEYFQNNKPNFRINAVICPGCSIKMNPVNYKNVSENDIEGITAGKYPTCAWTTDLFTNWATQNAVNRAVQLAGNVLQIAQGLAMENTSSLVGGAMGIANMVAQNYEHELTPDSARGNINCGDVICGSGKNTFIYYQYSVDKNFARIIDNYFSRFGYKTNLTKIPNITGRRYWNFIQIADSEVLGYGEVPQKFVDEINKIARQGVTIWHDHQYIGDYTLNNTIV